MEATIKTRPFEWSVSSLTHRGETDSGDKCVVEAFDGGALVAVIDALGHGGEAAQAAEVAVGTLKRYAHEAPVALVERCHAKMHGTRGAAVSLASFDWRRRTMAWLGIGNVAGVIMHADPVAVRRATSLVVRGGVVGDHLPELQITVLPLAAETTLVMATDGVRDHFTEILPATLEPQRLAERILDDYARHDDDATVLVFRCNGDS
jgi:hypothetical protein